MTTAEKARLVLDLKKLRLPPRPVIVDVEVEDYADWEGIDALRIQLILSEDTTDVDLTGESGLAIKAALRDALLSQGIEEFPYMSFAKRSELEEIEEDSEPIWESLLNEAKRLVDVDTQLSPNAISENLRTRKKGKRMAAKRKKSSGTGLRTKASFGTCNADHLSPAPADDAPRSVNIAISFEESLKLHFALGQALAKLNSYDRSRTEGKRTCVNLCLFPHLRYITVTESKLRAKK
ncbi:MAG: hypothetical protein WD851_18995 [Pirellulales bacterium]